MKKTKEQKRQEAIERFRKNYSEESSIWQSWQSGGKMYADVVKMQGVDQANKRRVDADLRFKRFLCHAEIDSHGNPLTTDEVVALKARTYEGYRGVSNTDAYPDRTYLAAIEYMPCNSFT